MHNKVVGGSAVGLYAYKNVIFGLVSVSSEVNSAYFTEMCGQHEVFLTILIIDILVPI